MNYEIWHGIASIFRTPLEKHPVGLSVRECGAAIEPSDAFVCPPCELRSHLSFACYLRSSTRMARKGKLTTAGDAIG